MKVKLHSNDKKAAEATDQTIRMLSGDGRLARAKPKAKWW